MDTDEVIRQLALMLHEQGGRLSALECAVFEVLQPGRLPEAAAEGIRQRLEQVRAEHERGGVGPVFMSYFDQARNGIQKALQGLPASSIDSPGSSPH